MQVLVPLVLALVALAFIFLPFWGGASPTRAKAPAKVLFSSEQLELDRELGKIDAAEYDELAPQIAATEASASPVSVENLIAVFRRQRRLNTALEIEIMVARARRGKNA